MTTAPETQGFICLGASAGGLRSIKAVLGGLGADLAWPVLVSQHMQAGRASQLPALLARATRLPVHEAVDGDVPRAGHVYVCPSSSDLGVSPEGRLALRPPVPGRPQRIDHLFSSASFARPGLVVAVVLSGTGTDGAGGALVVKLNGGTVLAESGASAQRAGMPEAAQRAGAVDAVRAAADMGPIVSGLANGALQEAGESAHRVLRRIASTLAAHTQTEFEGYRVATLRRRVERRRVLTATTTLDAYADLVARDADERSALAQSLLIPVTEFFRDPTAWQALAEDTLPDIVQRANEGERVRMWCAGCATGEEAFTLAMLVAERVRDTSVVEIVGTDLHHDVIEHARRGAYPASRLREVTPEQLERFFVKEKDEYVVRDELRAFVRFDAQDLTRGAPPGPFDLVVCRNVLIYFDEELQAKVLNRFRDALRLDGTLFLGRSELIPQHHKVFASSSPRRRLFQAAALLRDAKPLPISAAGHDGGHSPGTASDVSAVLLADSDALLLVLDASWRVASANARAAEVLGRGTVGSSLLDVLPAWQGSPVHDALRTSLTTGRSVRVLGAPSPQGPLDLTLEPFPPGADTLLLVAHAARPPPPRTAAQAEVGGDLAAANDELQAANEELATANEELQASNEELASLNEEFQSTNENLAATNAELRAGADVAPVEFLRAMLTSRQEPLLLCDRSQRVVLFNPAAGALLGIGQDALGHALDLRRMGIEPAELLRWLESCAPGSPPLERSSRRLRLRIEALAHEDGIVGWLLACWPPAPAR